MFNFIKADILRVLKKKSYIVLSAIVLLAYAATLLIVLSKNPASVELVSGLLATGAVLLIGIPVFIGVFSDDFHSKAMQTIIGFGTSRRRLVLSRYCEYLVILAQAFAVISLVSLLLFAVTGNMAVAKPIFRDLWKEYLSTVLCVGAAMIIVYGAQNTTFGLVIFIGLAANILDLLLTGISFIPFFANHNIDVSLILPSNMLNQAMSNGKPIFYLFAALCYIVLPLVLSVKLFEKKELEF
ncbi:MAG: hypothetical protein IJI67_01390 [Clostridia bacterium]|nr:hypothetical protein [Clostridia bacterium]